MALSDRVTSAKAQQASEASGGGVWLALGAVWLLRISAAAILASPVMAMVWWWRG